MDLETENRIAAILLKEAAELRRQAQSEGALAYIRQPTVRNRPNTRFLTATVRGVQQANRAVEVNEMWRLREKQIDLDNRLKTINEGTGRSCRDCREVAESRKSSKQRGSKDMETSASVSIPSKKRNVPDCYRTDDEGLRDDEVDEFLHSRSKRGRGAVGSRMDETGPYLSKCPDSEINASDGEVKKPRVLLGPEKPSLLKYKESSDNESSGGDERKRAKVHLSKRHTRKHKLSKDKKKRKKEKNRKQHK